LSAKLRKAKPSMKVLYMSGFPENQLSTIDTAEVQFIAKPFSLKALRNKVKEVLDH